MARIAPRRTPGPGLDGGNDPGGDQGDGDGGDGDGDDDSGGFGGDGPGQLDATLRWVGDLAVEVAGEGALALHWRGDWRDAGGEVTVEARTQRRGWHDVVAVGSERGGFRLSALSLNAPYTFRLRRETADGKVERSSEVSAVTDPWRGRCRGGARYMCLRGGRFEVRAHWSNPDVAGDVGNGGAIGAGNSDESGMFWFFDPANVELAVKVLDGRATNGAHWVFFGALTDVEYTLTATDTVTGLTKAYTNEQGSVCGRVDTNAF